MTDFASKLILLPGMGADARLFAPQSPVFPQLQVATWIPPEPRESLAHYAERMVDHWHPSNADFLGGVSFGGVVALEMAALIQPLTCFLIGSIRHPNELPATFRRLRSFTALTSGIPALAKVAGWILGRAFNTSHRSALMQLSDADGRFLQWATRALLDWCPSMTVSQVNVLQLHGQRDWLIPAKKSRANIFVPDAGHLLTLTHPREVHEFLRRGMEQASAANQRAEAGLG